MKDAKEKLMQEAHKLLEEEEPKEKIEHKEPQLLKHDSCSEEIKRTKEALVRLQAEFENYRKRTQKEKEDILKNASAKVLKSVLDIVDEFELALASMPQNEQRKGIEMLYANMLSMLKREGVEPIHAMDAFDPYVHECLKREQGPEGKIVAILKKGYLFKGSVLRHALVIVGNGGN